MHFSESYDKSKESIFPFYIVNFRFSEKATKFKRIIQYYWQSFFFQIFWPFQKTSSISTEIRYSLLEKVAGVPFLRQAGRDMSLPSQSSYLSTYMSGTISYIKSLDSCALWYHCPSLGPFTYSLGNGVTECRLQQWNNYHATLLTLLSVRYNSWIGST